MKISVSHHIKSPFVRQMAYGLASLLATPAKGTGGTSSAEYCYSVYLRHLVVAYTAGLPVSPKIIAEIGPGDSLGIGLAAMLAGAEQYFAFDVVDHANMANNLGVFDRLVELFKNRSAIPAGGIYQDILPNLDSYEFPASILSDLRMEKLLDVDRIHRMRAILARDGLHLPGSPIRYFAPWGKLMGTNINSVDMIISQAAMEHVDDLAESYNACFQWLRPGGFMSHQIDFGCHDTAEKWNGHWAYSDPAWKIIRGARPWLLNRHCYTTHIELIKRAGFEIIHTDLVRRYDGTPRSKLADRFINIPDDDLNISSALIQARKPLISGES